MRLLIVLFIVQIPAKCFVEAVTEDSTYWKQQALNDVKKYLRLVPNTNIAKNVILFIGDGLGASTITAARILKGQINPNGGHDSGLFLEKLPYVGLSKVYSVDKQVPDSAATATAIMTGVKTRLRMLGLDNSAEFDVCKNFSDVRLTTMLDWAQKAGKSTGIVTTTRITHATPAAAYAHVASRYWEHDKLTPSDCQDIAYQLIHENPDIQLFNILSSDISLETSFKDVSNGMSHDRIGQEWNEIIQTVKVRVLLGGGRANFLPANLQDGLNFNSQRHDDRNLIIEWLQDKQNRNKKHQFVWNKGQFDEIDPQHHDYLFGLFSESHMNYDLERRRGFTGEPSLAEMTRKAIQILQKKEEGFFLMVEGGRIDHGHHENSAKKALYDTLAFDDAVKEAMTLTDESDTLVIVTGDHSHVLTIAGYPDRENGILDLVHDNGNLMIDLNNKPYTTLAYANGPTAMHPRQNLTGVNTASDNYKQESMVPMAHETHSGEDVPIYASGPMAHLLTGVKEQNVIAYVMAHAACVGDIGIKCDRGRDLVSHDSFKSAGIIPFINVYLLVLCYVLFYKSGLN